MKFGVIESSLLVQSINFDGDYSGTIYRKNVSSNSVGFGAVLVPNVIGELVEAQGGVTPDGAGLYLALDAGTGNKNVLCWGNGRVRNDSWSFTPGAALFISRDDAGEITDSNLYESNGDVAIGYAETATTIVFSPIHTIPEVFTAPFVMTLYPADDEPSAPVQPEFSITFDQAVYAQSGNINLYRSGVGLVEAFDVTADISGSGTDTITFTPTDAMLDGETYYVQIDATAFDSAEGLSYAGIADETTWNFDVAASSVLWSDNFNRADGPSGWLDWSVAPTEIVSNKLNAAAGWPASYGVAYHMCGGVLPADYLFTISLPHALLSENYLGITTRAYNSGTMTGVRVNWTTHGTALKAGVNTDLNTGAVTITVTGGFPASWSVDQDHTFGIESIGVNHRILLDGEEYGTFVLDVNNQSGTGVGVLGEGHDGWDNAIVEAV